jgi:mannose-6-phosphate isomerase-like protein (cupin superfamily)
MEQFEIVQSDNIEKVTSPINYNVRNPVLKLMNIMEESTLMAEDMSSYLADSFQYMFPFSHLELYGPAGDDNIILDPLVQDNKTDFQKQNIKDFTTTDVSIMRGWASADNWTGPFIKLSYLGGHDSQLSNLSGHQLSSFIYVWANIQGKAMAEAIAVPYNTDTDRYEVEIWGYPAGNLFQKLSPKGQAAFNKGYIVARPDLVGGSITDFNRDNLDDQNIYNVAPGNVMHPLLPLKIELAWADHTKTYWDSKNGANYHYTFNMILRGWDNYMQVGVSGSPHGGVGFLHYRNLLSNYKSYTKSGELSRSLKPWMFDANHTKTNQRPVEEENFLAVEYVDLHILKGECAIGIHRHRDNQEIFFLMNGKAIMVAGDWCQFADRERAFEIRTLLPGSFSLLKAGQLHALVNALDIDAILLMFGGYD